LVGQQEHNDQRVASDLDRTTKHMQCKDQQQNSLAICEDNAQEIEGWTPPVSIHMRNKSPFGTDVSIPTKALSTSGGGGCFLLTAPRRNFAHARLPALLDRQLGELTSSSPQCKLTRGGSLTIHKSESKVVYWASESKRLRKSKFGEAYWAEMLSGGSQT
jgi:hypothetical protein